MSEAVKKQYTSRGLTSSKCKRGGRHHSESFHKQVAGIKAAKQIGKTDARNPYAIAMARLKEKAFKK